MKKFFKCIAIASGVVIVTLGVSAVILDYIVSKEDGTNIDWDNYKF